MSYLYSYGGRRTGRGERSYDIIVGVKRQNNILGTAIDDTVAN